METFQILEQGELIKDNNNVNPIVTFSSLKNSNSVNRFKIKLACHNKKIKKKRFKINNRYKLYIYFH